ncbi:MAG: glycoside hydrolase family 2 protein [Ignavibacteriota bacterium]
MKNKTRILFFIVLLLISNCLFAQVTKVKFDKWSFKNVKDTKYLPATVPGTAHTDLLANGIIEDPFYRDNEKKVQWIEQEDWIYRTEFSVENLESNRDLVFEGLDTYAQVYLNGQSVLNADNMFMGYRVKGINKYLNKGNNILEIVFHSPIAIEDSLAKEFYKQTVIKKLPGTGRIFTRKAAYHYGWDWSPRFVTCGIWRNTYMEVYEDNKINNVCINQAFNDDYTKAFLYFNIDLITETKYKYEISIVNKSDNTVQSFPYSKSVSVIIENPKLWWSNGLGKPYLYDFVVVLKKDSIALDTRSITTGIRKIELIQENDSEGKSFYFKLNGVPVFMKGANYIPADNFLPRVTKEKYRALIKTAKETNMNMLRVWGGGVYEDDEFYNQCDENGILVWQDFMFACAMYPWDKEFLMNVWKEATYNVMRLYNHPSIALWCGNNEIDEGWQNWGWQNSYNDKEKHNIWNGYKKIFNELLPLIFDSPFINAPYISSSPEIGWGHKESMTQGDSHYWGVWWGMEKFDTLEKKVPRFMSEYGFQGFPDTSTINRFTDIKDRYLFSDVLKTHQKHPTGYETLTKYMEMYGLKTSDYNEFMKNTQTLQILCLKTAIEAQRRAMPYCMGTLLWQFNDCNPVVSWSLIDYYGMPKPSLEVVKRLYDDILIIPVEENGVIKVYVVNDRNETVSGKLTLQNRKNKDETTMFIKGIDVEPNSSKVYFERTVEEFFAKSLLECEFVTTNGKKYYNEIKIR